MMLSPELRKLNGGVVSLTPTRSFPRNLMASSESARGDDTIAAEIAPARQRFFQRCILFSVDDATYSLAPDCPHWKRNKMPERKTHRCAACAILLQRIS